MRRQRLQRNGFTLVELLIVVIILAILAAIVIPQFSNASQDSASSAVKSQLQEIRTAIQLYRAQHMDRLPDLSAGWTPLLTQSNAQGGTTGTRLFGPYLQSPPVNSLAGGSNISTSAQIGVDWVWNAGSGTVTALDSHGNAFNEGQ